VAALLSSRPVSSRKRRGGSGVAAGPLTGMAAESVPTTLFDVVPAVAARVAADVGGSATVAASVAEMDTCSLVLLAHPGGHAELATRFVALGVPVISLCDDPDDARSLLGLHRLAVTMRTWLIVGAGMSPGLAGLLTHSLTGQLAAVDEVHVATHGTGGPACARQHHDALGGTSPAWFDGDWVQRPGGSGRELCWFPDPIGAHDCYRLASADPITLHEAFPLVARISARSSATRRDRLTARLPMLSPPHRDGDAGAVRVEVRGADADGGRQALVVAAAGDVAELAALTMAAAAVSTMSPTAAPIAAGAHVLGSESLDNADMLRRAMLAGITVHEFTGVG
jgi:hypothetical protein